MKKRIIAALIMIPLTVAVLLANDKIVLFAVTLLSLAAAYEISLSYGFGVKETPGGVYLSYGLAAHCRDDDFEHFEDRPLAGGGKAHIFYIPCAGLHNNFI